MSGPLVIPPGGGEVIGDSPERRVEILADHDGLHATWTRFAAGRAGADLHVHRRHTDLFFVLDGELTLRLSHDGAEATVPTGTLAHVPPLVVHGFRNGSERPLHYLNFHAPGEGFADYMRALRAGRTLVYDQEPPPADGARPPEDAVIGGEGRPVERAGLSGTILAELPDITVAALSVDRVQLPAVEPVSHGITSLYVFEGELVVASGDGVARAPAGAWVQLRPEAASSYGGTAGFLEIRVPDVTSRT
jgi:mannose-6-phosphate isomerase-like protein (cupin superfamily)